MSRVLVIDDDAGTLLGYKGVLREAGHEVATAALGEDGLAAARREPFDAVLCDQWLPDGTGINVVRQIRQSCPATAIVLVTGWGTPELEVEARRAGVTTYAQKPLIGEDLIAVVDHAIRRHVSSAVVDPDVIGHAARRWADLVVRGAHMYDDPKTTLLWCRGAGVSHSTLQNRCDAAHVKPKESLDLLRLLRVTLRHAGQAWNLQAWLEIIDDRTVRALLERAHLSTLTTVPAPDSFLAHQQLISRPELIDALRMRLVRGVHY
jgi:DNA-binding response OmpR family regulator